jgi:hypothetical protein
VAGGNIGFQRKRKMPWHGTGSGVGNRAKANPVPQDFELNI